MAFQGGKSPINQYSADFYDSEAVSDEESFSVENESYLANVESDSYDPEWVDEINESGELFYVGSSVPVPHQTSFEEEIQKQSLADISSPSPKSAKTKGRLKLLAKYNKVKNGDLGPREVPGAEDTNSIPSPKVTFQEPRGELKEVFLEVDPKRHNYGRRATLCEILFGIIPGHFDTGKHFSRNGSSTNSTAVQEDTRIMVHGLIPDGEAMKSDAVKIGDWLRSVNDIEINFSNLHHILSSFTSPTKVKLTLQRFASQYFSDDVRINSQNYPKTKLAKLVTPNGNKDDEDSPPLTTLPHIIMYLTVDGFTEKGSGKEDILYQFPEIDNKLTQIRGLFITVCHTLTDITSSHPLSSSLVVDGKLFHVGYANEKNDLLIIGLPDAIITLSHLHQLVQDLVRLLNFKYQSLHKAFSQKENKSTLNHMFSIILHQLFTNHNGKYTTVIRKKFGNFQDAVLAAHSLLLPNNLKVEIHNTLSEFEANEFVDLSDDYYEARRSYTILGSCLFYKGYLLANHLPQDDLLDTLTYMKHHGLLSLTYSESISRVIIWKEIFPTRRSKDISDPLNNSLEVTGRWFLMIIGLKQYLLGIILEAGGCSQRAEGNPGPDPCFINQAETTLLQLESMQISSACETWLNSEIPALANVDWFVQSSKGSKENTAIKAQDLSLNANQHNMKSVSPSSKKSSTELISILKKRSSTLPNLAGSNTVLYDNESDTSHSVGTSATSSLSDENIPVLNQRERLSQGRTSSSDADSRGSCNSILYKTEKKTRMLPGNSSLDLNSLYKTLPDPENLPTKLTTGSENVLFHFIQLDLGEGVFISPKEEHFSSMLSTEVIENFQNACISIHKVFQNTLHYKKMVKEKDFPRFGVDHAKGCVKEQGMLFQCSLPTRPNQKKPSPTISYWVVGRLFNDSNPREVYVCFLDSIPQNIVEMAFKLNFGIMI